MPESTDLTFPKIQASIPDAKVTLLAQRTRVTAYYGDQEKDSVSVK